MRCVRMTYWYAPGMLHPYWEMYVPRHPRQPVAHNADSDTDMGDLTVDEFFNYFPHAFVLTRAEYEAQSIDPDEALERVREKQA